MTRLSVLTLAALLASAPVVATECEYDIDADAGFDGTDLTFVDDHTDEVVARITEDAVLFIAEERIALDETQRAAVRDYRTTFDELMVEAKEIGFAGARLGTTAALKVVAAIFTGSVAEVEAEIEAEAAALEERADSLCAVVETLQARHVALAAAVPAFAQAVPAK